MSNSFSRRGFLAGGLGIVAAGALAGCSSDSGSASGGGKGLSAPPVTTAT